MDDQQQSPEISYEVRVKPGRTGTDPEAPDWEVLELEDAEIKNNADIYDNRRRPRRTKLPECGAGKRRSCIRNKLISHRCTRINADHKKRKDQQSRVITLSFYLISFYTRLSALI